MIKVSVSVLTEVRFGSLSPSDAETCESQNVLHEVTYAVGEVLRYDVGKGLTMS